MTRFAHVLRVALVLAAILVVAGSYTALPVVIDLRATQVGLCLAAAAVLALSARSARGPGRRALAAGLAIAMAAGAAMAGRDLLRAGHVEEVAFTSGGILLRGSLFVPRNDGPHPAIVLVHGSGPLPRDEYRYYARRYAARGIMALAYDKRGAGDSGGDSDATYEDLAADAAAAIAMLRARADVDAHRVGLWGLSEGEWVAPLAAITADPAFLVLVSPSAMTPAAQVRYETGANVRAAGFGDEAAREAEQIYARVSAFERTGEGREQLNRLLADASARPWFEAAENLGASVPPYDRVLALSWFPAWRSKMDFDALPLLARLDCPVLAQVGGSDPKNDGAAALERIRAALAGGGHEAFTGLVYPRAGHNVVEWRLPFGLPPPWFAPGYLDAQLDWVTAQVGLAR